MRHQILKRGIKTYTGIGRQMRRGATADGILNKYELEKALIDFHIQIPQEVRITILKEWVYNECAILESYDVIGRLLWLLRFMA